MEEKLRSYFYLGSFEKLFKNQGKISEDLNTLCERALVMMGKPSNAAWPNLQVLKKHQQTYEAYDLVSDPIEEILSIIMAINNNQEVNIVDTLKATSLEKRLLLICCLLKIRRPDITDSILKTALKEDDEEGALSFLLACSLFVKGEYEEAGGVANELIAKYGESAVLLNIFALTMLQDGNSAKAEGILSKALVVSKETGVREHTELTLRNLIACKRLAGEDFTEVER